MKCDQCQENYYDLSSGCVECPPCYGLVQDAVNDHRTELQRLETMVRNIGDRPVAEGDDFLQKLNDLKKTLEDSKQEANALIDKRNDLNDKVEEVNEKVSELIVKVAHVASNVDSCATRVEEANDTTAATKELMERIDDSLDRATTKLNEATNFINEAKTIALDSLSKEDNMTKLADEADAIADQHEEESEAIVSTAQKALDTSNAALDAIQDAITTLNGLIDQFEEMNETRLPTAIALRDELAKFSEEILEKTKGAKENATELLTEAEKLQLSMPDYDVEELNTEIRLVSEAAGGLAPKVDALNDEYMDGRLLIQADIDRAETLLATADTIQDTTDMLTAQAHSAKGIALEAVRKGDAAYQSLLDTEASLETFSSLVEENKRLATESLDKIPRINGTIDDANTKTTETRESLGNARELSDQARSKAKNAQNIAEQVQREAKRIRFGADDSRTAINEVKNDVNAFKNRVDETQERLEEAEATTNASTAAVKEAEKQAANAKTKADAANAKVKEVLARLTALKTELDNLEDLDPDEMERLENDFAEMQERVNEADLEGSIVELQKKLKEQQDELASYDEELNHLRVDIANVERIDQALPVDCEPDLPGVENP